MADTPTTAPVAPKPLTQGQRAEKFEAQVQQLLPKMGALEAENVALQAKVAEQERELKPIRENLSVIREKRNVLQRLVDAARNSSLADWITFRREAMSGGHEEKPSATHAPKKPSGGGGGNGGFGGALGTLGTVVAWIAVIGLLIWAAINIQSFFSGGPVSPTTADTTVEQPAPQAEAPTPVIPPAPADSTPGGVDPVADTDNSETRIATLETEVANINAVMDKVQQQTGEEEMKKSITAALLAAGLNLSSLGVGTPVLAADLTAPDCSQTIGGCKTIQVADNATGCSIEVQVDSNGNGYPANEITAWANGGKIRGQIRGSAAPHEGKVYIPVDCSFAQGNAGQVCFGNGEGMARNLQAHWFVVARENLSKGIKVLNGGDQPSAVLGFADS